jgi:class 3 adenylate cyclase/PAS domain-containing protein
MIDSVRMPSMRYGPVIIIILVICVMVACIVPLVVSIRQALADVRNELDFLHDAASVGLAFTSLGVVMLHHAISESIMENSKTTPTGFDPNLTLAGRWFAVFQTDLEKFPLPANWSTDRELLIVTAEFAQRRLAKIGAHSASLNGDRFANALEFLYGRSRKFMVIAGATWIPVPGSFEDLATLILEAAAKGVTTPPSLVFIREELWIVMNNIVDFVKWCDELQLMIVDSLIANNADVINWTTSLTAVCVFLPMVVSVIAVIVLTVKLEHEKQCIFNAFRALPKAVLSGIVQGLSVATEKDGENGSVVMMTPHEQNALRLLLTSADSGSSWFSRSWAIILILVLFLVASVVIGVILSVIPRDISRLFEMILPLYCQVPRQTAFYRLGVLNMMRMSALTIGAAEMTTTLTGLYQFGNWTLDDMMYPYPYAMQEVDSILAMANIVANDFRIGNETLYAKGMSGTHDDFVAFYTSCQFNLGREPVLNATFDGARDTTLSQGFDHSLTLGNHLLVLFSDMLAKIAVLIEPWMAADPTIQAGGVYMAAARLDEIRAGVRQALCEQRGWCGATYNPDQQAVFDSSVDDAMAKMVIEQTSYLTKMTCWSYAPLWSWPWDFPLVHLVVVWQLHLTDDIFVQPAMNWLDTVFSQECEARERNEILIPVIICLIIIIGCGALLVPSFLKLGTGALWSLRLLMFCPPDVVLTTPQIHKILTNDFAADYETADQTGTSFYESVVSHLLDGVLFLTTDLLVLSANHAVEAVLGMDPTAILGKPLKELLVAASDDDVTIQSFLGAVAGAMDGQRSPRIEADVDVVRGEGTVTLHLTLVAVSWNGTVQTKKVSGEGLAILTLLIQDITASVAAKNLLVEEGVKSEKLLLMILPPIIVTKLQTGATNISFAVKSASIMFVDIVSFTPWCGSHEASYIMATLNRMFLEFDRILKTYDRMTKIKCIGDCYMCAGGIFDNIHQPGIHALQTVSFGLDIIKALQLLNIEIGETLKIRVGVNTGGPIVAGVLGIDKPTFDILGPAICFAAMMEQRGVPMNVHIPQRTYDLVCGSKFVISERGNVEVKGKMYNTYVVSGYDVKN